MSLISILLMALLGLFSVQCIEAGSDASAGVSLRGSKSEVNSARGNDTRAETDPILVGASTDHASISRTDVDPLSFSITDADSSSRSYDTHRQLGSRLPFQSCGSFRFNTKLPAKTDISGGQWTWNKNPADVFTSAQFFVEGAGYADNRLDIAVSTMPKPGKGIIFKFRFYYESLTRQEVCDILSSSQVSLSRSQFLGLRSQFEIVLPKNARGERSTFRGGVWRAGAEGWPQIVSTKVERVSNQGLDECHLAINTDFVASLEYATLTSQRHGEISLTCDPFSCKSGAKDYQALSARRYEEKSMVVCRIPKQR